MVEAKRRARSHSPKEMYMNEIVPNLWLGGVAATKDKRLMESMGITHVMSFGYEPKYIPDNAVTKYIEI